MASDTSPISNQFPLYGWTVRALLDLSVANGNALTFDSAAVFQPDFISPRVERAAGLHRVGVYIQIPAGLWVGASTNKVNFILEGSNDGLESTSGVLDRNVNDHWTTIAELDLNEYFDGVVNTLGSGQIRLLGQSIGLFLVALPNGSATLDVDRFKYVRVRAEVVAFSAPLEFTMNVFVQGIGGDCESFDRNRAITYEAGSVPGDFGVRTSDVWKRPEGTRFFTAQAVVDDILLDGTVTSVPTNLQGAFTEGGPFFTIATFGGGLVPGFTTLNEAATFQINGRALLDMDPFIYFRFMSYFLPGLGVPGAGTRYTISYYPQFDGNDVTAPDTVNVDALERDLAQMFIQGVVGEPEVQVGVGVGATRDVQIQVTDIGGRPIRDSRPVIVSLSQPLPAGGRYVDGLLLPSPDFEIDAVPVGGQAAVITGQAVVVLTTSFGIATIRVRKTIAGAGSCFLHISNYVPQAQTGNTFNVDVSPGQVLIREEPREIVFTP